MKIALFGGSFDPVHRAHRLLAESALNQFGLDRVVWIPAFLSPFKQTEGSLASAAQRFEMVCRACSHESRFSVSDYEISKGGISYSIDTLRHFKTLFLRAEFFWILGWDALMSLPKWKEFEVFAQDVHFLAAPRGNESLAVPSSCRVSFVQMDSCPISSTAIRSELALNRGWDLLDLSVAAYIQEQKLYGVK